MCYGASVPRTVDHAARRRRVAEIAAELVATRGVDALTHRQVAQAAGYSTTIVSHYFADKRDLLLATFQAAGGRMTARFEKAVDDGETLLGCLLAVLPIGDDGRRDWNLVITFWGVAATDQHLAED